MIETIYEETLNEVITSERISDSFKTERGVRQECPLSSTLFNIFLDDIDDDLITKNSGGTVIGKEKVFIQKFADDIVMIADFPEGLSSMLKSLEKYTHKNKLEVNAEKSKIMIFRKGGKRNINESWNINGQQMEIVNDYKYLGFKFSTKSTFDNHITILSRKAQKAINAACGVMKRANVHSLKTRLYLLDTLVKSGMLYGVELWGWEKSEKMEKTQGKYVKMIMGLSQNTPNYIWRMESGRRSVEIETRKRTSKYLLEILNMHEDRLPKKCLMEEIRGIKNSNPSRWGKTFKKALEDVGDGTTLNLI